MFSRLNAAKKILFRMLTVINNVIKQIRQLRAPDGGFHDSKLWISKICP